MLKVKWVPASHPQSKRTIKKETGSSDRLEQAQRGQGMHFVKEELKPRFYVKPSASNG